MMIRIIICKKINSQSIFLQEISKMDILLLKLNKPLLIHKIIGNKSGCYQIYNRMRAHSGHRQHKKVCYNYNADADVVKQEVKIHYTIVSKLFETSLYEFIHRGWVLGFRF